MLKNINISKVGGKNKNFRLLMRPVYMKTREKKYRESRRARKAKSFFLMRDERKRKLAQERCLCSSENVTRHLAVRKAFIKIYYVEEKTECCRRAFLKRDVRVSRIFQMLERGRARKVHDRMHRRMQTPAPKLSQTRDGNFRSISFSSAAYSSEVPTKVKLLNLLSYKFQILWLYCCREANRKFY